MNDPETTMQEAQSPRLRIRTLITFAIVVALAAILTLHRLGAADVCGVNEAVEGVFLQQMVEHGAVLFPLENGHSPMYKPPLFHWTATAIDRAAGIRKVTAFNLRLPAALYAIAGVILTIAFTYQFIGGPGAILAGLILCGSYQYIEQGRIGRVDMTLCFFETLALFAFMWWYAPNDQAAQSAITATPSTAASESLHLSPNRGDGMLYLFAAALGLGVLAKGPVGAIIPAAACGIFLIAEKRHAHLRKIMAPGPLLLALIIGGSWYAACLFGRRYGFLDRQIGSENFGRFFGTLGAMAPWYYVKPLFLNSAPLSLFVPFAVYFALRTYWHPAPMSPLEAAPASREGGPRALRLQSLQAVRLFAIFWLVTVIFFTLAAYKRRAYLLPLWPASAVMLAWWIETLARTFNASRIVRGAAGAICITAATFNFFYLPHHEVRECHNDSYRQAATEIDRIVGRDEPLYSYGLGDEPAPLLFYIDRNAPPLDGRLGDAPPGYVIIPADKWDADKGAALDLEPVFESSSGRQRLILLRHGKAYTAK